MKRSSSHRSCLLARPVVLVVPLVLGLLALAPPLVAGDPGVAPISPVDSCPFGPDAVVRDEIQGIEFLRPAVTEGRLWDELVAETGEGGKFEGWNTATIADLQILADSYAIENGSTNAAVVTRAVQLRNWLCDGCVQYEGEPDFQFVAARVSDPDGSGGNLVFGIGRRRNLVKDAWEAVFEVVDSASADARTGGYLVRAVDRSEEGEDTTPPSLFCPGEPTIGCPQLNESGLANSVPIVSDDCDPCPRVECDPPPAALLDAGDHEVVCAAVDAWGNRATCSFTVTVLPPEVAISGPDRASLLGITSLSASIVAFDDPDQRVAYSWEVVRGPCTIAAAAGADVDIEPNSTGNCVVRAIADVGPCGTAQTEHTIAFLEFCGAVEPCATCEFEILKGEVRPKPGGLTVKFLLKKGILDIDLDAYDGTGDEISVVVDGVEYFTGDQRVFKSGGKGKKVLLRDRQDKLKISIKKNRLKLLLKSLTDDDIDTSDGVDVSIALGDKIATLHSETSAKGRKVLLEPARGAVVPSPEFHPCLQPDAE